MISDRQPVGTAGTASVAADPGGAVFGLWQAGDRDGFEKQGEPGSFCWAEVYTRDPERVDAFYESVFGFGGRTCPTPPSTSVCGRPPVPSPARTPRSAAAA